MARFIWKTVVVLNRKSAAAIVCVLLAVALASCKHNESGSGPEGSAGKSGQIEAGDGVLVGGGKSFAHITAYKPEVKLIDKAMVDASIQGIGSDGRGVVFKNAAPEILALKAGDILLVKNAFAAKVLAAETVGDQTVLITDEVGLADVVQQGEINVDNSVSFHGPKISSAPPLSLLPFSPMDLIETPLYAKGGVDVTKPTTTIKNNVIDAVISGWKIEKWSVTAAGDSANISARFTKKTNGFNAAVSVDGSITNFKFVSDIHFPFQGSGNQMVAGVQGMSGHMHFVWEIGKDTPGVWAAEDKINLPGALSIPLGPFYMGVPLSIEISSAYLIHPALTGGNEYSKGGFTIGWVGSKSAGATVADGQEGFTFQITDDANLSPIAPNAMVISFCVPRIELKFSALSSYAGSNVLKVAAAAVDATIDSVASRLLSPSMYNILKASPIGKMTASNVLASSADVFVQIIHTEGVTHSSSMSLAPCSKMELSVTGQWGGDAKLFGITDKATTTKDLFTKKFTQWNPGSAFCKGV